MAVVDTDSNLIQVAEDVYVQDAFVDWSLNSSNRPTISVIVDGKIPVESFQPVDGDPDEFWIAENSFGVFSGWQTSPPTENATTTTPVEHHDLGIVDDRFVAYDHVVARHQNDRDDGSAVSVRFKTGPKGTVESYAIRVELLNDIIEAYINGEFGSDPTALWYWMRDHPDGYGWYSAPVPKKEYGPYNDAEVVLVRDSIYTWYPARSQDVTEDDVVYGGGVNG